MASKRYSIFSPALWSNAIIKAFKESAVGCDIHVYIEKRTSVGWQLIDCPGYHETFERDEKGEQFDDEHKLVDGDHPHGWNQLRKRFPLTERRNYRRFAKLAGVRGEGPDANGWPEDVSARLRPLLDESDLHSHCHYSLREAAQLFRDTHDAESRMAPIVSVAPEAIYFNVNPTTENVDDYRVLIAFDN